MSVRFVFGRAGTGKSYRCLEAVRQELRRDALHGPPLLMLVPEQATLQTERALLSGDLAACHRVEVLSFQRLAYRVLESRGLPARQALSEPARAMVLRHLLQQRRSALRYYRRVERNAGFIDRLAMSITEFIAEAITPEDLHAGETSGGDDPRQADKLHDLSLLYAAYLDYLGTERVDPSQYFELATAEIPHCYWLHGGLLFMDGFASLSRRESLLLLALARQCVSVEISVLLDPDLAAPVGHGGAAYAARLFRKTHETWHEMHQAFVHAGMQVEKPVLLRPAVPPRFARGPALAAMEKNLFSAASANAEDEPSTKTNTHDVELVQWPTQRLEVQYAVSCIQRWVSDADSPWRYRDIAILVRDLEVYHDLLVSTLAAHGIPFFIDRRRPIAHHPLIELLRGGIALLHDRFGLDSVRLLLKTGLLPIERDAADELENYLLAHGIQGPQTWQAGDWKHLRPDAYVSRADRAQTDDVVALERINAARRQFVQAVRPLDGPEPTGPRTGAEWAARLRAWLAALDVAKTLSGWISQAETEGDFDLAAQHRQAGRDVPAFLDDLESALPDMLLTPEEFSGILEQGLSRLTLGLTPPTLDQVLVGTIERSRQPALKGVVVLGFNEGCFPRKAVEDSVLNDDDRTALRLRGLRVAPPARLQSLDEALLVYLVVTRASQRLVISCAAAGADGAELRPSPYVGELCRACPGLELVSRADPLRIGEGWDVLSRRDLTTRLALEMRMPPRIADARASRARWNAIYERALPYLSADRTARSALTALAPIPPVVLSGKALPLPLLKIDARTGRPALTTGVSALESYAACPFQFFAVHALRLRPRQEMVLAPVDIGQIRHAILEEFFRQMIATNQSLGELGDAELDAGLVESCRRAAARLSGAALLSHGRDAHALRGTRGVLAALLRAQRDLARVSSLHPRATELAFGFDEEKFPALQLSLGENRPALRLRGYMDRVDLGLIAKQWVAAVIDYKDTRDQRLDMAKVFYGLALQLPAYLIVLRDRGAKLLSATEKTQGDIRPAAALFVSLSPSYGLVDGPDAQTDDSDAGATADTFAEDAAATPRGLINFDLRHALDRTHESQWSQHYRVFANKEGKYGHENSSDGLPGDMFDIVLRHTAGQLVTLGLGIAEGDFDVRPVRLGSFNPCSWCAMGSVCRVEVGLNPIRYLSSMPRGEALKAMKPKSG